MIENTTEQQDPEGLDESLTEGWGDYPLDSVFVRNETRTVAEVVKRIKMGRYQLDPDFQRDFVWPIDKQSRLIESCLMRIPLPVLYVAEAKSGRIAVVDGLQRLTTFSRYLNDDFALSLVSNDENSPHALDGSRFSDLPVNLQERIEDTQLIVYILDANAPERAKLDIFERVNSGVPLTRQQMRNCLFNGRATQWLKQAATSESFLDATGRSLDAKSMRDREAINRFCAFYLLGDKKYRGDMDAFLAQALEKMQSSSVDLDELFAKFTFSMKVNRILFGDHAFRKSLSPFVHGDESVNRSVINIALFDVYSVLFSRVDVDFVRSNISEIRDQVSALLGYSDFINAITYSTNSSRQVKTRFAIASEALEDLS
ncbi:DUF262 domain-containing protein [Paraburkholderia sp. BL17N1]|uniref:GmrSD restriction endonuclease domain-containing protein n=1 Tax=Paraburkholderia sp. BL17N1 TaxID=1938798 RepID=UPI000EB045F0|nr:DUF262 domain-containing protein [Paraburkholderia sp. BL17N1]RKR43615.1 uncharacterized protein DUF262 [Paraburkholderia sp. BL17N1]